MYMNCADVFIGFIYFLFIYLFYLFIFFFSLLKDRQQSNFILVEGNEMMSHSDLSQFAQCIMRVINPIWINMPDKEIRVHWREIQNIFPISESANNGRPVQNAGNGRTLQIHDRVFLICQRTS